MTQTRNKIKRSPAVVDAARARDLDICQCCGCGDGCEVHHIEPLFLGGADEVNNAICLCTTCHNDAPDNPERFLAYQRSGGAFWFTILRDAPKEHQERLKQASVTQRLAAVDQMRLTRWGWMSGSWLYLDKWEDGEKDDPWALIDEAASRAIRALDVAATLNVQLNDWARKCRVELDKLHWFIDSVLYREDRPFSDKKQEVYLLAMKETAKAFYLETEQHLTDSDLEFKDPAIFLASIFEAICAIAADAMKRDEKRFSPYLNQPQEAN